jgi:hypothetical protein
MRRPCCRDLRLGMVVMSCMAGLSADVFAQTGGRPAVVVRQLPTMLRSALPADLNQDGRIDLIAGEPGETFFSFGRVVVRTGNGDGTFGAAVATGVSGFPVVVGDFNGDSFLDVVVVGSADTMSILPGSANGTFGSARPLDPVSDFRFALARDMNADGRLDLVLGHGTTVEVQPGVGDFTFGPAMTLPAGAESGPSFAVAADLNGDSRPDLAIAQAQASVMVYLNNGGLLFSPTAIVVTEDNIFGLGAGDLDRDGDQDLIVPHSTAFEVSYNFGGVDVLLNRGNGAFAAPVSYATGVTGPRTVVTGDFNRDGLLDVAVGGRSHGWNDLSDFRTYWDSVSIFAGRGNGVLSPAAVFRLDSVPDFPNFTSPYVDQHHALSAADVNRDGHLDLVASPGAILLNRLITANRPPTAQAVSEVVDGVRIVALNIAEPDWDWLRVEWRDQHGVFLGTEPSFEFFPIQDVTLTATITDVRGGVGTASVFIPGRPGTDTAVRILAPAAGQRFGSGASIVIRWESAPEHPIGRFDISVSDNTEFVGFETLSSSVPPGERQLTWQNAGPPGTTWRVRIMAFAASGEFLGQDISDPFTIDDAPDPGDMPWPWVGHADVGAVGRAGSATYSGGVFTVRGSGADIWGTADEFHAVTTRLRGSFSITARVTGVENVHRWTKAGIMLRDTAHPSSRHAMLLVTPTTERGVAFQRRPTTGGTSVHTAGPVTTAPIWLKLVRAGDVISAFYRKNTTDAWTLVGAQAFTSLPFEMSAMLVVSSHIDGRLAAATFDQVLADEHEFMSSVDIGTPVAGTTTDEGATLRIEGNGADIWNASDAFRFHRTTSALDASISVRVRSLESTHVWAKAGVMFRDHDEAQSAHVMLIVSPGRGVSLQYRSTFGGFSAEAARRAGTAPEWLRLTRRDDTFIAETSDNGLAWTTLGSVTVRMNRLTFLGLAVTSHTAGTLATAVFDDLVVQR